MDVNKQSQQAGEGSQLVQAGTIVINQGVSEERVKWFQEHWRSIQKKHTQKPMRELQTGKILYCPVLMKLRGCLKLLQIRHFSRSLEKLNSRRR